MPKNACENVNDGVALLCVKVCLSLTVQNENPPLKIGQTKLSKIHNKSLFVLLLKVSLCIFL